MSPTLQHANVPVFADLLTACERALALVPEGVARESLTLEVEAVTAKVIATVLAAQMHPPGETAS